MAFDSVISGSFDDFAARSAANGAFAFEKRTVLPKAHLQLQVSFMEIPPGPAGAHRMTNVGDVPLRYVDIDSTSDPDVFHYPDSGKTGWFAYRGGGGMHRDAEEVEYYEGEPDAS